MIVLIPPGHPFVKALIEQICVRNGFDRVKELDRVAGCRRFLITKAEQE